MDAETRRFIQQEIARRLGIILFGSAGSNTAQQETINDLYPGQPGITDRPIMHPYGISSRAPAGTISVVGRTGDHSGNRTTLGHMDRDRPDPGEGGTILYDAHGNKIQLQSEGMEFEGKDGVKLLEQLIGLIQDLEAAKVITGIGPQQFLATDIAKFSDRRSNLETLKGGV